MTHSYLVKELIQEKPEVLQVVTEFEPLARRTELSLEDINTSIATLGSGLYKMKKELEKPPLSDQDHFNEQMNAFYEKANTDLADLRKAFKDTQECYANLCARFGENPKTVQSTDFFGYVVTFLSVLKQSHKHLLDLQAEEKLKKIAADEERQKKKNEEFKQKKVLPLKLFPMYPSLRPTDEKTANYEPKAMKIEVEERPESEKDVVSKYEGRNPDVVKREEEERKRKEEEERKRLEEEERKRREE